MKNFSWRKILAVTLVLLMAFETLPIMAYAEQHNSTASYTTANDPSYQSEYYSSSDVGAQLDESDIVCELVDKRDAYSKHFLLNDRSIAAVTYNQPVHEKDEYGEWVEISCLLESSVGENGESVLTNEQGGRVVTFAKAGSDNNILTVQTDGQMLGWNLVGASDTNFSAASANEITGFLSSRSISQEVLYENIIDGIDLQYFIAPGVVKDNIIINRRSAADSFTFLLRSSTDIMATIEDQMVYLRDADDEIISVISAPFMVDANGEFNSNIQLSVNRVTDGWTITLTPDMAWLSEQERAYPVIIDPEITDTLGRDACNSTSVTSAKASSNEMYQYGACYVGREPSEYGNLRGAITFTLPTTVKDSDRVIRATLSMKQLNYYGNTSGDSITVNVHQINQSVPFSTMTWNNLNGKFNTEVLDSQVLSSSTKGTWIKFDVTKAVSNWYQNGGNYGLVLKSLNEGSTYKYATLYNSHYTPYDESRYPTLTVYYLNSDGIDEMLSYHSMGNDETGILNINDYNGNLVYQFEDFAMDGEGVTLSITHNFNHSMRSQANSDDYRGGYGCGFRLSIHQRVIPNTDETTKAAYPYIYYDGDGTKHYFVLTETENEYSMETDNSIILYTADTKYANHPLKLVMGGMEYYFNTAAYNYLAKIVDPNTEKTLTFTHDSTKLLTSITDSGGRVITFNYYDSGHLSSITLPDGSQVSYTYDSSYRLISIARPDSTVTLGYSGYGLVSVTDDSGYKYQVGYSGGVQRKVSSVTEYGSDGTRGKKLVVEYDPSQTKFIDCRGSSVSSTDPYEVVQFDSAGRTVNVFNSAHQSAFGGYESSVGNSTCLKYASDTQSTIINYVANGDFEDDAMTPAWSTYNPTEPCNGTQALSTEYKYDGSKSLKLISTGTSGRTGRIQEFDLTSAQLAGNQYTVSAYIKVASLNVNEEKAKHGVMLEFSYKNASGVWVASGNERITTVGDFVRYSHTFTFPEGTQDLRLVLGFENATGTAYFDNIQLEPGAVANPYNYIDNGYFKPATNKTTPSAWVASGTTSSTDGMTTGGLDGSGAMIAGNRTAYKKFDQTVYTSGNQGDSFVVGLWGKAPSLSYISLTGTTNQYRDFGIRIYVYNGTTVVQKEYFHFPAYTDDWQYVSGCFTTKGAYTHIMFSLMYYHQQNTCVFDNAQMLKQKNVTRYTYDNNGNMLTATDSLDRVTSYSYQLVGETYMPSRIDYYDGSYTTYTYSGDDTRLASEQQYSSSGECTTYNYTYRPDSYVIDGVTVNGTAIAVDSTQMTADGLYVSSTTSPFGTVTSYDYNGLNGRLNSVNCGGVVTNYTYDTAGRVQNVSSGSSWVNYTYSDDVDTITHSNGADSSGTVYKFNKNEFGNLSSVMVGDRTLVQYDYAANTGNLNSTTYGNGDVISYNYNTLDEITSVLYNGSAAYSYDYTANNAIGRMNDYVNGVEWRYEYDLSGNLLRATTDSGLDYRYTYDYTSGRLTRAERTFGGSTQTVDYIYDANDRLHQVSYGGTVVEYHYDGIERLSSRVVKNGSSVIYTESYTYATVDMLDSNGNPYVLEDGSHIQQDTERIASVSVQSDYLGISHTYQYDAWGNIDRILSGEQVLYDYTYDALGQLIREDNQPAGRSYTYSYDNGGNITQKCEYAYSTDTLGEPISTHTYTYGDATWGDLLTAYDGVALTYDGSGNVTSFGTRNFSWTMGRQLSGITDTDLVTTYKYDVDGLRVQKTVNGVVTTYYRDGETLLGESTGNNTIIYEYDNGGAPVAFTVGGVKYYYVTNVLGDIVNICDASGNVVVSYTYDAWGNVLDISGTLAGTIGQINPYRYRSYYYDSEVGYYYLQSRYYDPQIGRFINADSVFYCTNLFAYCLNCPVMLNDHNGYNPTLNYGSTGRYVYELQRLLNQYGANLAVDGIYGVLTQKAVRNYQSANNLLIDGICGPQTWHSLLNTDVYKTETLTLTDDLGNYDLVFTVAVTSKNGQWVSAGGAQVSLINKNASFNIFGISVETSVPRIKSATHSVTLNNGVVKLKSKVEVSHEYYIFGFIPWEIITISFDYDIRWYE